MYKKQVLEAIHLLHSHSYEIQHFYLCVVKMAFCTLYLVFIIVDKFSFSLNSNHIDMTIDQYSVLSCYGDAVSDKALMPLF
ncbi:hypothetical protein QVD17_21698 [Tagetes erecta]|uniref:Uncharacterized protein n=1 Tax=Tagetes erecta TaxID=13708 RepID=A0AAD8KC89_TARER|nr:hypothetical protein QVD17_21698 [Tagetes erecta]